MKFGNGQNKQSSSPQSWQEQSAFVPFSMQFVLNFILLDSLLGLLINLNLI